MPTASRSTTCHGHRRPPTAGDSIDANCGRSGGNSTAGRGRSARAATTASCLAASRSNCSITASGKDKSALGRDDFVRVDAAGQRSMDGSGRKSSAETLLHCLIADLVPASAGCRWAPCSTRTPCGARSSRGPTCPRGSLRIEGFEMLKGLEGIGTHDTFEEVPIFANTPRHGGTLRPDPRAVCGGRLERPRPPPTATASCSPATASTPGAAISPRPGGTSRSTSFCSRSWPASRMLAAGPQRSSAAPSTRQS